MMQTEQTVREELIRHLGEPAAVSDRVWGYLIAEGHVAAVERGERDVRWLSERVHSFLEHSGQWDTIFKPKPSVLAKPSRVGDRLMVFSKLLANDASGRDDVKLFREKILGGQLLKPEQVEPWIMERERIPKPPAGMRLMIEAPADFKLEERSLTRLKTPILVREIIGGTWDALEFATPDSRYVRKIGTPAKTGPLASLRSLSESLAYTYDWQKAQATLFVLTGLVPIVSSFSWSVTPVQRDFMPRVGARRIKLDFDLILSPKDVAAEYAKIRRKLRPEKSRRRELSAKHLTLAYFLADRGESLAWNKRLQIWNKEYPRWEYGHESNFRRDALRATERVLSPEVEYDAIARALWIEEETSQAKNPTPSPRPSRKRGS